MIRIGAVNIDTSHPQGFADYLLKGNRARYTAVYNDGFRGDDEVEGFIKSAGLEKRCTSIEELVDCVDLGMIHSCNWNKHIEQAMPFIQKGKPVFLDKPIVGSLPDCRKIEQLAEKGVIILGSSSARYAKEIVDFLAIPEEERGEIVNIFGTCGVDEFNYGIHIAEIISEIAGAAPISVKYCGRGERNGKVCETFFIKFENDISATYNIFIGIWQPFELVIMTTKTTYQFRIDSSKIYGALLDKICDFIETGESKLESIKKLTESVKIMLAGRISRTTEGKAIYIADIPLSDSGFDGYKFEKQYAENAVKIYR